MLRIAVCEDVRSEAGQVNEMLEQYQLMRPHLRLQTEVYFSADELLDALDEGKRYELYLLDIMMPGTSGIDLARTLHAKVGRVAVIFTTYSQEHAVEAFSARAINYLLKPLTIEKLAAAIDDVLTMLGSRVDAYACIPTQQAEHMVKFSDIIYVEVTGHRLSYFLAGGTVLTSKVLRIPFEAAAKDLLADGRFLRPHRSFLVNAEYIDRLTRTAVILTGDVHIPISRLRFPEVKAGYMRFLGQELS